MKLNKKQIMVIVLMFALIVILGVFVAFMVVKKPDSKQQQTKVSQIGVESDELKQQKKDTGAQVTLTEQQLIQQQTEKEEMERKNIGAYIKPMNVEKTDKAQPAPVVKLTEEELRIKAREKELMNAPQVKPVDSVYVALVDYRKKNQDNTYSGGLYREREVVQNAGMASNGQDQQSTLPSFITPYKFYKGALVTPLDSGLQPKMAIVRLADGQLNGWTLVTNVTYFQASQRFSLSGTILQDPKGNTYQVKADVYSIDQTPGIISHVKYGDMPPMAVSIAADFAKGYADWVAKSKEDQYLTTTVGIVQQTTNYQDTRTAAMMAGMKQATDTVSQYAKEKAKESGKEVGIAVQGTPCLVMFYK